MKEETKPSSFTVNTIVYVEKLKEYIVNVVELLKWLKNVPGYKIKDNCFSEHQKKPQCNL